MDPQNGRGGEAPDDGTTPPTLGSSIDLGSGSADNISEGEPVKITAIYDNGGRTLDRYTVLTNQPYNETFRMALGVGANPHDFSQWTGVSLGDHLGRVVTFESLDGKLQKHIAGRVFEETK